PIATFISAGLNLPVDAAEFDEASQRILDKFEAEWGWMYETTHTDGSKAKIDYTIWSEVFTCPNCGGEIVFYDAAYDPQTGKVRDDIVCPTCASSNQKRSLERRFTTDRMVGGSQVDRIALRPVRIAYRVGGHRFEKTPDEADLAVLDKVRDIQPPTFPTGLLPVDEM